jgi:tetratricopeptide (TPR) repeat protein
MTTPSSRDAGSRRSGPAVLVVVLFALSLLGVARLQPRLAATTKSIKAREDVYIFPPPAELRAATLGYVAAVTDLIWAKLLVEYGIHWAERRSFPDLNRYVDALIGLDPKYKPLYEMVDTMVVYRPIHGTEEDARAARAYLEKGLAMLPYDPDIWLHYGQFVAFMGPSYLTSEDEKMQWRKDGALALERAAELGAEVDKAIVASSILSHRFGENEASIRFLKRAYALADDEATKAEIAAKLELLNASREEEQAEDVVQAIDNRWRRQIPFVSRDEFLLLGPLRGPASCAGPGSEGRRECAASWDDAVGAR